MLFYCLSAAEARRGCDLERCKFGKPPSSALPSFGSSLRAHSATQRPLAAIHAYCHPRGTIRQAGYRLVHLATRAELASETEARRLAIARRMLGEVRRRERGSVLPPTSRQTHPPRQRQRLLLPPRQLPLSPRPQLLLLGRTRSAAGGPDASPRRP